MINAYQTMQNISKNLVNTGKNVLINLQMAMATMASSAKNRMATTPFASLAAITMVSAGLMLAPAQSQASTIETWNASFLGEITLSGVGDPFVSFGTALFAVRGPDGNMINPEGTFSRLNDGPNPNWITLTGNEFDELGNQTNTGISGTIGLLSIGEIVTVDTTLFGPFRGYILHTTAGDIGLSGSTLFPLDNASIQLSRPVSSVPVPAAGWLFASGLPMLVAASRKRKSLSI